MTSEKQVFVGPYILGRTLGRGCSGKVKIGFHKQTGVKAAVKIVKKAVMQESADTRQRVEREIKVLRLLSHPNIMKAHDVLQTSTHLFLILEYLDGGELYEYISQNQNLPTSEVFKFFYQLVTGVAYMHAQSLCHRDLKLENLFIDTLGNLKIADFGMASAIPREGYLETSCGSPHYACPEIVRSEKYHGTAADVWSCGVILYALATSSLPFDSPNGQIDILFEKIRAGKFYMPPELPASLRDLISKMLKVNGSERITLDELQSHPFWLENLVHVS
eukprot:TRINITY_DN11375_c0_g2_i1.p1 TRINITY_DN11375_c0_g2~~TRINITY_DN11375_c0_g2_i1.p1  ORF type:complete len:276 (+),score=15.74 TRINITY_DN11375_c0_g2_i1:62-889(+)